MARKSRRNGNGGNGNSRGQRRSRARPTNRNTAARILATGVGAAVPRPFGGFSGYGLQCWDAKCPAHLGLPRAVGPYTTIRATRQVSCSDVANIIGTYQLNQAIFRGNWSETVMTSGVDALYPIDANGNAKTVTIDLGGLGEAATLVPSALTVQIMCPTSLQSASGVVYAGVMNTQSAVAGRTETWASYMRKFVQFQTPRLLAASKLALRGVQISSYPLNMSEVSKFTPLSKEGDTTYTYDTSKPETTGWAPIIIYNPNSVQLELLITVEYRVRFDLSHPASASHKHHPIASDQVWDKMVKNASALGNGVLDIAEVVANTGQAVSRAVAVGQRLMY